MLSMSDFVPSNLIKDLQEMGKEEWVKARLDHHKHKIQVSIDSDWNDQYHLFCEQNPEYAMRLLATSKALANGKMLYQPTYEQMICVTDNEHFVAQEEYRQPFPVLMIEWPDAFRQQLSKDISGYDCPKGMICFHDQQAGILYIGLAVCKGIHADYIRDARGGLPTCTEEMVEEDPSILGDYHLLRIAMSFCHLLATKGCRDVGPANPKELKRIERRYRNHKDKKKIISDARRRMTHLIDFDHEVVFDLEPKRSYPFKREDVISSSNNKMKPHRRAGHIRRVKCGKGRTEVKLVFIEETFVNKKDFKGDPKNFSVLYKGKKR